MPRERWEVSTWGLVWGIVVGILYLALAYGAKYALGELQRVAAGSGVGVTVTSNVFSFMAGPYFFPLVVALVAVNIAHGAIRRPLVVRGPLTSALGVLTGVFYYLIFGGGVVLLSVALRTSFAGSFSTSITLLVTLALLEVSAGLRVVQGVFEFREARGGAPPMQPGELPATTPPPVPPGVPAQQGPS